MVTQLVLTGSPAGTEHAGAAAERISNAFATWFGGKKDNAGNERTNFRNSSFPYCSINPFF
jgi:hypothetical protein